MKKFMSFVVCALLVLSMFMLAGCNDSTPAAEPQEPPAATDTQEPAEEAPPAAAEQLQIAYFVSDMTNTFHQARFAAAKNYGAENYGMNVVAFDGKSDSAVMTENIDQIVAQGMDAACLQIWDAEAAKPGVLDAIDRGIKIANFFNPFPEVDMPAIRNDEAGVSFEMGKQMAEQWKKDNPDTPIVFVELGWPNHTEVKSGRTDPFVEGVLSVDPTATDLGCLDASEGGDAAKQIALDLCAQHPEVNIIYSEASNLTVGVMAALVQAGRGTMDDGVATTEIVCSVDCDQVELKQIYDPNCSLKFSMFLPPKDTSIFIIDTLMDMINGDIPQISTPPQELFANAYTVSGYVDSQAAVDLYNDQFNDNFAL
ncbi:MAG: substrate-binding domain-containing protein [Clostridiales bacterium]|nr:substrate-binding domain-containing protein [Clostridiales bacterium]